MKTTKIYISLFFLTFFSTLCFAQESEISINEEENKTTTVNQNTLLAPPFAIQIHQSTNIAEANKIKSEAKRNFPGMSTKLKSNQNIHSITLGNFNNINEAQQKLKTVKTKYPSAVLISNQKE
ncbi:MAG: SPOR domain-containing protein [Cellulophaga sp.]|uniref:SPOR domain-containing protein n=1 Tax=Cellulophaga sp. TaxID=1972202 RepID=UPI003266EED8